MTFAVRQRYATSGEPGGWKPGDYVTLDGGTSVLSKDRATVWRLPFRCQGEILQVGKAVAEIRLLYGGGLLDVVVDVRMMDRA